MKKKNLLGLGAAELEQLALSMDEKAFRGRQLYHQIYQRRTQEFDQMPELPKDFRRALSEKYSLTYPEVENRTGAADGTVKFLLRLEDTRFIETVFIPEGKRQTLCVSSQIGCDVGCTFCRTAQMPFQRNLHPGEIVGQLLAVMQIGLLRERGFNLVFMGMGEPLYNYQNLGKAFRIMIDPSGMGLSHRKITVSTSGVVPVLKKMATEETLPNLAISLNATTNKVRDAVMPINQKWNLEELMQVCRSFPLEPRRRLTFEYVLLKDVTDSDEDARRLAKLVRGARAKVNLIPYNPGVGLGYARPHWGRVKKFQQILMSQQVTTLVRRPRGDEIAAACGQLAYLQKAGSAKDITNGR